MSDKRDPARALLSGLLAGDVALLDEVGPLVVPAAFSDPVLRDLFGHVRRYRERAGGVLTRPALDDLTAASTDAGTAALLRETYGVLTTDRPDEVATRWAADRLRELHRATQVRGMLADAGELLRATADRPVRDDDGRVVGYGPDDAVKWINGRTAEYAREAGSRGGARTLRVTAASAVVPRRVRWLWDRRIVLGGLTLLAGREGLGKSTVAVDLAANVTRGTLLGEHHGTPRSVVYVHSEDARDYTVVPRLIAAGADLDRVIFVDMVTPTDDGDVESPIVLPTDVGALAETVTEHDAALVVLDAATSVIDSKLDGDRDRQMRQGLEAIARGVGERTGAAVLGIVHFGKRESADTGKLILGSIAWSQVARSVLAVARDDETQELVVSPGKANLGAPAPSVGARIVSVDVPTDEGVTGVGRVEWTGETDRDARDMLSGAREHPDEKADRDEAVEWLCAVLADAPHGEMGAAEVFKEAEKIGLPKHTVQRARKRAGVTTRKAAMGSGWVWALATDGDDGSGEDDTAPEGDTKKTKKTGNTCAHESVSPSSSSVSPSAGVSPSTTPTAMPAVTERDDDPGAGMTDLLPDLTMSHPAEPIINADPLAMLRECGIPVGVGS